MIDIDVKVETEKAQQEIDAEQKKLASIIAQMQSFEQARQQVINKLLKLQGRMEYLQSLSGKKKKNEPQIPVLVDTVNREDNNA